MDDLSMAFYDMKYKEIIRERTENEFEDFFSKVMQMKYKDNFMPCRPWGQDGDKKNDGYLIRERHLFAVNGPHSLNQNRMLTKINNDFTGALDYWEEYFDKWSFVHNQNSLPPRINKELLKLSTKYNSVTLTFWGPSEIRGIIFSLEEPIIRDILGPVPSKKNYTTLKFEDIQPVIKSISRRSNPRNEDLKPVPENKLLINGLSDPIIGLIKAGLLRAPLVRDYLNLQTDLNLGDQISETLRNYYEDLRDNSQLEPDDIYSELAKFITDPHKTDNQVYMAAVHTILAYFFEQCTIFERVSA
ncbi:ABC-three component system protein [Paenibacillus sp. FSL R5-0701]|uniref:ABC-three component system protein n=1 Tax=Paenibacillus sp. FSL R5-0701 TaxID=2921654 RepID=UPI0030D3A11A